MFFDLNESEIIGRLENVGDYFTHSLSDHPLLQMDEIRKLVKRLPEGRVFYSAGIRPESAVIGDVETHPGEHPMDHAIDHMDNANAYMFIISPETDAKFNSVYVQLKDDIDEFCRRHGYQLTQYKLALFISSPGAVAPHHIDHQHSFIAQIKGSKTVYQWPAGNFDVTTPEELEIFFARVTRKLAIKEDAESLRTPYVISPGKGAYIPFAAPHSVVNGDEVSISLSLIFNTKETRRLENVYRANYFLRNRCRLSPTLPGESALKDELKNQYLRTYDLSVKIGELPGRAVGKLKRMLRENDQRVARSIDE